MVLNWGYPVKTCGIPFMKYTFCPGRSPGLTGYGTNGICGCGGGVGGEEVFFTSSGMSSASGSNSSSLAGFSDLPSIQ